MPDLTNKNFLEARKRAVLGRINDPNYKYHNTSDAERCRKEKMRKHEELYDDRKRVA
jgi:hypothetical protein